MLLRNLGHWLADHWKLWGIPSAIATTGSIATMFYKLRKARAEARIAKIQSQQAQLAIETDANAELLRAYTNNLKQIEGTHDLIFSEEKLRGALGKEGPRLHAVLNLMLSKGTAKKAKLPGYWIID